MENKTILIVDDTVENLDILAELLEDYDVIDATDGQDALEILKEEKVDLILLDVMMPELDGFELCSRIKENPKTKDIPIIFITALTDEESIVKAYDIGGSDYITKPFKKKELLAKVRREFKLQELQKKLKLLASTDPLTKLYNRRYFTEISRHFVLTAKRENQPLSLLMIDIDEFKSINDSYGHDVGDRVIVTMSQILVENQRKSDVICRWGGEEFLVLLPNTSLDGAFTVGEKFRKRTEDTVLDITENRQLKFTISVGISQVNVKEEESLELCHKESRYSSLRSKKEGRNCVVLKDF
ncbi:MAG: diguanylate cyclase [Persephonella sp.]|nr:diguanylate cyclase [Persephonella sp.]